MANSDNTSVKGKGVKMKVCRRCNYTGKVNEEVICSSCNEEVIASREVCKQ